MLARLGGISTTVTPAAVSIVSRVTAMPAVAEHMHCDHPDGKQHPHPVLRKPFHEIPLYHVNCRSAISLITIAGRQRYVDQSLPSVRPGRFAHERCRFFAWSLPVAHPALGAS